MVICPSCAKILRDNFAYCRFCGSKLTGEEPGDYSTDMLNVFKKDGEYMYLFSENGNQVVIRAGSIDELAGMVCEKHYPWEFRDWKNNVGHAERESVEIPEVKTEFLRASSLKEPEVIPTASAKRKRDENESYVPNMSLKR